MLVIKEYSFHSEQPGFAGLGSGFGVILAKGFKGRFGR